MKFGCTRRVFHISIIESIYTNIYDLHSRESSCSKFCLAEELVVSCCMNSLLSKSYNYLESLQHVQQVPQLTAEEFAELIAARLFSNVQII